MKPYIVAITGASGILYGVRFLQVLAEQKVPVGLDNCPVLRYSNPCR